ncbi:hypothetical protein [Helicobacter macacae]|nr:hypothetical protein [Helicobacter macacae]
MSFSFYFWIATQVLRLAHNDDNGVWVCGLPRSFATPIFSQ